MFRFLLTKIARNLSSTGIYDVMLRGINQQDIFEDEDDDLRVLAVIRECDFVRGSVSFLRQKLELKSP